MCLRAPAPSLASPGSRSGPKMKSAARARTTISPQPIESNTTAPVLGAARRSPLSVERAPLRLVQPRLDLTGPAAADDLDGDRVAGLVRVDRDDELLRAAHRLTLDGDDDVLLADARRGGRAAGLDVQHQGAVT